MEEYKQLRDTVNKSEWAKDVPAHLIRALSDGVDYYAHYETGGRVDYLALIGYFANKLNQQEKLIEGYKTELTKADKLNEELITNGIKKLEI